eukprot:scaffold1_cov375-Pavlova_lutheri.AAC.28
MHDGTYPGIRILGRVPSDMKALFTIHLPKGPPSQPRERGSPAYTTHAPAASTVDDCVYPIPDGRP